MPAPSAQQERRARLEAEAAGEQETPEQIAEKARLAAANDNSNNDNSNTDATKVTISRAEFNDLQAASDRVKAAERRADAVQGDLAALQSRLTELEEAAKGKGTVSAPARPEASAAPVEEPITALTDKEKADFEDDTVALMEKIANNVFSKRIAGYKTFVEERVANVESVANTAATSVQRVSTDGFTAQVRAKVGEFSNFDLITKDPHWAAFMESEDELSGFTYAELVKANLNNKRLDPMVKIFKKFYDKYLKDVANTDGYAGSAPSGVSNVATSSEGGASKVEILHYSERQKAQQDYLAQPRRITYDEYEAIKKKFDLADREGRVDYTK